MPKPLHTTNFPFQLTLKPAPVGESGQVVRKRSFLAYVQVSFELEQRSGAGQEQIDVGRVSDVTQSADFVGPAKILGTPSRRSLHNDRDKLGYRIGPDPLGQLVAIHARHHDVRYHEVRLVRLNRSERLNTVTSSAYLVAGKAQCCFNKLQFIGVIVDYENVGF